MLNQVWGLFAGTDPRARLQGLIRVRKAVVT